jgi:AcrR family transcriptional regulator
MNIATPAVIDDEQEHDASDAPRARDADTTRQLLLAAARRRFALDGYSSTTVRDIASDAGVNVALINRYFTSKEGLFEACLSYVAIEFDRPASRTIAQVAQSVVTRISAALDDEQMLQLLLLLRSSGDERADLIRRDTLRSFAEKRRGLDAGRPRHAAAAAPRRDRDRYGSRDGAAAGILGARAARLGGRRRARGPTGRRVRGAAAGLTGGGCALPPREGIPRAQFAVTNASTPCFYGSLECETCVPEAAVASVRSQFVARSPGPLMFAKPAPDFERHLECARVAAGLSGRHTDLARSRAGLPSVARPRSSRPTRARGRATADGSVGRHR